MRPLLDPFCFKLPRHTENNDLNGAVTAYERFWKYLTHAGVASSSRLYELLEQWDEQLDVLQRQVALIDDVDIQYNLRFRIANLQDLRLFDLDAALDGLPRFGARRCP